MKETMAPSPANLRALLSAATERLHRAGIEAPQREARLLAAHAAGTDLAGLLRIDGLTDAAHATFIHMLGRRLNHEPMAYITGQAGFWSLDLAVSPATLIPRADSETLVEAVLHHLPDRTRALRVLDIGTGTGCLLLAVLAEYGQATGIGTDINPHAARLAAHNAARNALASRCVTLCCNWADAVRGPFDLVLSNPPYIPHADLAGLMPDVVAHEPARALDGGPDGLVAYRALAAIMPALLAPGGTAVLELGIGQDRSVPALMRERGLEVAEIRPDLGGIGRALVVKK
ncbi:methyltransferase [Gluconacetobacter sp. SXCC-1]|uniref:Release factor glutamine methyltransferase n=1 Tax=Komagataeibacter rhaeticus TaxID=215221 RepID=A0A181CAZ0_9PROT|nr:peptide chain release factor N(5)-glutamine methyltransferase [Komagataeibacter rhaeticus]ATU72580.1 peptide chain release factor N(5)-glutamine methyltransferase [Komagataeibacter xylinus]EGG74570.1 methyltransferase [Gluconacetobacter sp. SXCC-1]QIP35506.1 peptide chain release factor N(5)-glutamine methyltransferase [Komagataeibacter rhaeticus]QOC45261.1 peptide chain release factor N(5)-glutamine methyltransferase [Komagataeibacter rhaeticus]WPP22333.1 peptide chain release factor N(5)-